MKNKLCDIHTILGDENKLAYLVNEFDAYWEGGKDQKASWENIDWICEQW